jgi:hypothetical protein
MRRRYFDTPSGANANSIRRGGSLPHVRGPSLVDKESVNRLCVSAR